MSSKPRIPKRRTQYDIRVGRENCNKLGVDIKEQLEVKVRSNQIWQDHRPRDYHNMRAVLTPPHLIGFTVVHIKSTNKELSSAVYTEKEEHNTIRYPCG